MIEMLDVLIHRFVNTQGVAGMIEMLDVIYVLCFMSTDEIIWKMG